MGKGCKVVFLAKPEARKDVYHLTQVDQLNPKERVQWSEQEFKELGEGVTGNMA